jgi:hypothetical protein
LSKVPMLTYETVTEEANQIRVQALSSTPQSLSFPV